MAFIIALASRDDLDALAEVNRSSYSQEIASRFAHNSWTNSDYMFRFFKGRLGLRFNDTDTQIFKATDPDTRKIVGFACWTRERNIETTETPTSAMISQMPPEMNKEFIMAAGAQIEELRGLMKGHDHYYLSSFAVQLEQQSKSIGSQLLRHCLDIADKDGLPTWLISFPGSHTLYLRFGFVDVDHRDVDLNAWDNNRMRGFGIYRQYAMVRRLAAS